MWRKIYLILIGRSITVPQVGIIVHFAKCLEFAAFKTGGGGDVKTVFLKLNGFNEFRNKL